MRRRITPLALLLFALACGSEPTPDPATPKAPATAANVKPNLAPSDVTKLGVDEMVTAPRRAVQEAGRKAVSDLAIPIFDCLRETVERDPTLTGDMSFTIQLGPRGAPTGLVTKTGSLGSLPSATCVASVVGRVGVSVGDEGDTIRYALKLNGTYQPKSVPPPLPELKRSTLGFDWTSLSDAVAPAAVTPIEAADAAISRCLLGRESKVPPGSLWVVLRVDENGVVMLDGAGASVSVTESEMCVRRKLEALKFPATRGPFAIAAAYKMDPPKQVSAEGTGIGPKPSTGLGGDGLEAGMIGLGSGTGLGSMGTGSGFGTGQGFGSGRLGGSKTKPPSVRAGSTEVTGKLPAEVISRIVRQNLGRFRLCYENGLRTSPNLAGVVKVTFTIRADGTVSSTQATGDLVDSTVRACVARAFTNLSFPTPEGGGVVKVIYPISFSPGDDGDSTSSTPSGPPAPKVDGKLLGQIDVPMLERVLQRRGLLTRRLPGSDPMAGSKEPVVVLFRDDAGSLGVARIVQGGPTDSKCATTHEGRSLIVTRAGAPCEDVLAKLLDR